MDVDQPSSSKMDAEQLENLNKSNMDVDPPKRIVSGKNNVVRRSAITSLKLEEERLKYFENSQFHTLLHIKNDAPTSALLIHAMCTFYDNSEGFKLNDCLSFTFSDADVAKILGIKATGEKKKLSEIQTEKLTEFPSFVFELGKKYSKAWSKRQCGKGKGRLSCSCLRDIVEFMVIDSKHRIDQYQQLMRFHLIENFLMPSTDNYCRLSFYRYVVNSEIFESINWAGAARDAIFAAASKLKCSAMKLFPACSPLFEAIIHLKLPNLKDLKEFKRQKTKDKKPKTNLLVEEVESPKLGVDVWIKLLKELKYGPQMCTSSTEIHEEEMLSENSDSSTSGEADDDELPEDSPSEKPASESSKSSHSFVVEDDQEQVQTNSLANSSPIAKPATLETDPSTNLGSSVEFGSMEGNIGTCEAKNHEFHDHGKDESHPTFPDISDEGITDVKPTVMTLSVPPAHENCYSKVKFQGVDISAKLIPTLESIWAKHGSLIGKDTVKSKKILASALEELAELVITVKYTTIRSLTDSQADDLQSDLLDFQRQGLKVDWLVPIIDKAVKLQKGKSVIESIMALDKEIAEADEKEREFLARSAMLKQDLKVRRAYLCSSVPLPETFEAINLDDFLGKDLW